MEYTTAEFSLTITGVKDSMSVSHFNGTEGLSQLFNFGLYLSIPNDETEFANIIGRSAVLTITNGPHVKKVSGILSKFWWIGEVVSKTVYHAELVPIFSLLTQRFDCRIFQDMSVPDVVAKVIKAAGITSDYLNKEMLRTDYSVREYCVQYRESDFNFISRLMEEEGIYYYFDHHHDEKQKNSHYHTLVMADARSCHNTIESDPEVRFHEPTGQAIDEEHIYAYQYGYQVRPGTVELKDFNYHQPSLNLQGKASENGEDNLGIYDYPGEFNSELEGLRTAKSRLQEMRSQSEFGTGKSNCCRFKPGFFFTLDGHGRSEFNKEYNLIHVRHSGFQRKIDTGDGGTEDPISGILSQLGVDKLGPIPIDKIANGLLSKTGILSQLPTLAIGTMTPLGVLEIYNQLTKIIDSLTGKPDTQLVYNNEFICMPSQTTYRPPRITQKPAIPGSQTAIVVGPKNEKIYMDDLGRVKVKFHWDRAITDDEKRTCFIRMAYPYAGPDHGMQFHPLVGDEVVVTFLEGDPDKPLITGVVYNGNNRPPLKPEDSIENIIVTPYQHKMLFSDYKASITLNTGGNETIYMADDLDGSEYGNQIKLFTADEHFIHLSKGTKVSGIRVNTQMGQSLSMWDEPYPASILLSDKMEDLKVWLNCDEKKILIQNKSDQEIQIDCRKGKVSVIGGGVEVIGGDVIVNGAGSVKIQSDAKVEIDAAAIEATASGSIKLAAPEISLEGSIINLDAPLVDAPVLLKVGTMIQAPRITATTGVVSPSYTPGAGNIS